MMHHPAIAQQLAAERKRDLLDHAGLHRPARTARAARSPGQRPRTGPGPTSCAGPAPRSPAADHSQSSLQQSSFQAGPPSSQRCAVHDSDMTAVRASLAPPAASTGKPTKVAQKERT